jgi:hypothetical protein
MFSLYVVIIWYPDINYLNNLKETILKEAFAICIKINLNLFIIVTAGR